MGLKGKIMHVDKTAIKSCLKGFVTMYVSANGSDVNMLLSYVK